MKRLFPEGNGLFLLQIEDCKSRLLKEKEWTLQGKPVYAF